MTADLKGDASMVFEDYFKGYLHRGITGGAVHCTWNYKDDLIVIGAYDLFRASGDSFYCDAVKSITGGILPEGKTEGHNLDQISEAKTERILEELTGDPFYHKRFQEKLQSLATHPRTRSGSFWHKDIYPYQVWCDGLYMCMPVYMQEPGNVEDGFKQFENVRKYIFDEKKRLYRHAWDESRQQEWADKQTGQSPCVWLRAEGWFLMALVDCYPLLNDEVQRARFRQLLQEAVDGIMPYQDGKTKMFYQLVDLKEMEGNYPETSGSAMVAYALMKGSRLRMLPSKYAKNGAEILEGIAEHYLTEMNGKLVLGNICGSAGLGPGPDHRTDRDGTPEYYLSEPIKPDNQHGTGACMMAYSEYLRRP